MLLLIDTQDEFVGRLRALNLSDSVHHVVDAVAAERFIEERRAEVTIVVFGPAIPGPAAIEVATKFREGYPELSSVMCAAEDPAGLLRPAMRAGVTDVIGADAPDDELVDAIGRAQRQTIRLREGELSGGDSGRSLGTVLTTFSTKGGCGKSLVATSLATLLHQESPGEVVLVDLDLQAGDVGVMLRLMPERGIREAVDLGDSLDEQALRGYLTTHESGLPVLTAPTLPQHAEEIHGHAVTHLLGLLRGMFRWVVVDGPPSFTDQVLAALDLTDQVIVITSMDVPSIKNLKMSIGTLKQLGIPRDRMRLVLNRADSKVGLTIREVERSLQTDVDATIPSSREVPFAINQGLAVVTSQPKAPVSRALADLLDLVRPPASAGSKDKRRRRR